MTHRGVVPRNGRLVVAFLLLGLLLQFIPPAGDGDAASETAPATQFAPGVSVPNLTPETRYYHQDGTANLAAMTDEGGQVVWRADLRPFGQGTANPADRPLRFAGQPQEAGIGDLYQLGARMYDPLTGRFLSPDPLFLNAIKREVPQRFNQYSYGLNNPYRYHDASGLEGTEFTAQDALKKFLRFYEAKLGPNPSGPERLSAFLYGALPEPLTPVEVGDTNNQPIRNRAGQEVDLDWGARLAGYAVATALKDLGARAVLLSPAEIAAESKRAAVELYRPAKQFWNAADWVGTQFGAERQTGDYRPNDPNIRGVELLIDYIVFGGDLRDYFDPSQVPPKR